MHIISINCGLPKVVEYGNRSVNTGIYKSPVEGSVGVNRTGIDGDGQADLNNHGGLDKAVYIYSFDNYRYWQQQLQIDAMPHGQFGENLTVAGMQDHQVHIGDRFAVGEIVIQVTQPRVPCFKLGIRMQRASFVKQFMRSGRVGFYVRVEEEGMLEPGSKFRCLSQDSERLTIQDAMQALLPGPQQQTVLQRALKIDALSQAWRDELSVKAKP